MITTKTKIFLWGFATASSLTIGGVAGKLSARKPRLILDIRKLSQEEKSSGKIFKALEHDLTLSNVLTPFMLFKCVNNSCNEIDAFTEMTFKYGDSITEIFKCTELTDKKNIPFYYFDQTQSTQTTPLDLDWSKLTRGKAEKRKWGQYIVIDMSQKNSCDGKITASTWKSEDNFWKEKFSMTKKWENTQTIQKDLSVFLKKSDSADTQYWWKPVARLVHDFDLNLIKNELKWYMPAK